MGLNSQISNAAKQLYGSLGFDIEYQGGTSCSGLTDICDFHIHTLSFLGTESSSN